PHESRDGGHGGDVGNCGGGAPRGLLLRAGAAAGGDDRGGIGCGWAGSSDEGGDGEARGEGNSGGALHRSGSAAGGGGGTDCRAGDRVAYGGVRGSCRGRAGDRARAAAQVRAPRGETRARGACGAWSQLSQCAAGRSDPGDRGAQHRARHHLAGGVRRAHGGGEGHEGADGGGARMIFGIGVDVLEVRRIRETLERFGTHFIERLLLPEEQAQLAKTQRRVRFIAMRFAAKEAIVKAMGTGFSHGVWIRDVGVVQNTWGKPEVVFSERGERVRRGLGVGDGHVTLTDEAGLVVAVAVLMKAKAMFALRRQDSGGEFLPLEQHRVVAISCVLRSADALKVWSLGDVSSPEAELIERFFDGIERFSPDLVSWNGAGFDLPVLNYRGLLAGVQAPRYWETGDGDQAFRYNNYLSRYHWRHVDLMDLLSGFQA